MSNITGLMGQLATVPLCCWSRVISLLCLVSGSIRLTRTLPSAAGERGTSPPGNHFGFSLHGISGDCFVWALNKPNTKQPWTQEAQSQDVGLVNSASARASRCLPASNPERGCVSPRNTAQVLPHSPEVLVTLGTGYSPTHDKNLLPNSLSNWSQYSG